MKNVWNIANQNEKKEKNPTKDDPFHQFVKHHDISRVWKLQSMCINYGEVNKWLKCIQTADKSTDADIVNSKKKAAK